MAKYSEELKFSIIKQMPPPENKKVIQISKETGIAEQTLLTSRICRQAKSFPLSQMRALT